MRILIVDDHIILLEALTSLFESQPDFTVVGVAVSVQEAISKARLNTPDIVLMDFFLEDGTGLDATEAILAEQPDVKIVFLTAHEEDDRLFEAIRYGAMGYLLKNISSAEMLDRLRGLKRGEVALQPGYASRILKEFAQLPAREEVELDAISKLTARELEVLRELQTGATNRQIAARLMISEQTVKNHVSHILAHLNLKSRHELIKYTRRRGS
jgi:two-component system response regulator NreC